MNQRAGFNFRQLTGGTQDLSATVSRLKKKYFFNFYMPEKSVQDQSAGWTCKLYSLQQR